MPKKSEQYRHQVDWTRLCAEAPSLAQIFGREAYAFLIPEVSAAQAAVVVIVPIDRQAAETMKEQTWTAASLIKLLVPHLAGLLGGGARGV